jgi:hypothetical protein
MKQCEAWAPEISVVNPAAILVAAYLLITASRAITAAAVKKNGLPFDLKGLLAG